MAEEEIKYDEKAKRVLKAIMDTERFDNPEKILVTYGRKQSQVINIKNDLGDLENAKLLYPDVIKFETNFKLFTKGIKYIEIVYVKKTIYGEGQIF